MLQHCEHIFCVCRHAECLQMYAVSAISIKLSSNFQQTQTCMQSGSPPLICFGKKLPSLTLTSRGHCDPIVFTWITWMSLCQMYLSKRESPERPLCVSNRPACIGQRLVENILIKSKKICVCGVNGFGQIFSDKSESPCKDSWFYFRVRRNTRGYLILLFMQWSGTNSS